MRGWARILLPLVFLAGCGETERKRRTVGYKGEARSNSFLAAQRLLEQRGYDVEQRSGAGGLDYGTSTLFLAPSSLNTVGRAKRLMNWVDHGGHLVLMVSGGEKTGNDFRMEQREWSMFDRESNGFDYLLKGLGVEIEQWSTEPENHLLDGMDRDDWEVMPEGDRVLLGSEISKLTLRERELTIHHWADRGLVFDAKYYSDVGSNDEPAENKHRFLSVSYGTGRVTVLSDARPLRNRYLGQADHAQLLVDLMDLSRGGQVVFTNGTGEGFFSLVWRNFWMAVVAAAVAVVFWLWKNMPRFGPVQDLPESTQREFSGQVRGIGRFLWKNKRDDALLGALRQNISRRIALTSGGQHEGLFEQLAASTNLPVEQVIEAMTRQDIREPGTMVRVTRNLQKIYQQFN